jgi:hypothetical protein
VLYAEAVAVLIWGESKNGESKKPCLSTKLISRGHWRSFSVSLNPLTGAGILVVVRDLFVDILARSLTLKGGASNLLPGNFGKPAFDLIKQRRAGRGDMHVIARAFSQPFLHFRMLVVPKLSTR